MAFHRTHVENDERLSATFWARPRESIRPVNVDLLVADLVQGPVADCPKEVGANGGLDLEVLPAAPQLDHDVLDHVFRPGPFPKHVLGHSNELGIVRFEYGLEGILLTGLETD